MQAECSSDYPVPAQACSRPSRAANADAKGGLQVGVRGEWVGEDEEWVFNRLVSTRDFEILQPEIDYLKGAHE